MERISRLTNFLLSLKENQDFPDTVKKHKYFLASVDCREVAIAQQNALQAGLEIDDLYFLWHKNKQFLPDQVAKLRAELPDSHILLRILAEHEMMLFFIADLEDVNIRIQQLEHASSTTLEIRKLEHIASHLYTTVQHTEREDQIIFPELKRRGFPGPSQLISTQHKQLYARIAELQELVWSIDQLSFDRFKNYLQQLVDYIVPTMQKHIFVENNVILPLATEIIDEPDVWERLKEVCDEIGYCAYGSR